jgi:formate dehydrogenase subunit delta
MQENELTRMANQIAAFFEAYPRPEALEGIAKHIQSFWDPRMRKRLAEQITTGGEGLSPLVIAAISPQSKTRDGKGKAKAK